MNTNEFTKQCKLCGAEMPKHSKICSQCGAKQKLIMTAKLKPCRKCGAQISTDVDKCPHCGAVPARFIIVYILVALIIVMMFALIIGVATEDDSNNEPSTQTSTETPFVSQIQIQNAYVDEDVLGNNNLSITVLNNSEYVVDAFDYKIEAYNTYGEKISSWMLDDYTATDISIASSSTYTASTLLPFLQNATTFKVAITRYHIEDTDETVLINSKERTWIDVQK